METEPWNEPGLTPTVRASRKESAVMGALNAYIKWWSEPGTVDDEEPDMPDFINTYHRHELSKAGRIVSAVIRNTTTKE